MIRILFLALLCAVGCSSTPDQTFYGSNESVVAYGYFYRSSIVASELNLDIKNIGNTPIVLNRYADQYYVVSDKKLHALRISTHSNQYYHDYYSQTINPGQWAKAYTAIDHPPEKIDGVVMSIGIADITIGLSPTPGGESP